MCASGLGSGSLRRAFRYVATAACTVALLLPPAYGADKDRPWQLLKHITHRSTLSFFIDSAPCVRGRIKKVADRSITINLEQGGSRTLAREKVLRITGYGVSTIYSGRSSWEDVKSIRSDLGYRLRVVTKDRRRHDGKATASDQEIKVSASSKEETIAKSDVAQVFYFTDRPASDILDEMVLETPYLAIFDPELWVYMIQKSDPLPILLYDASMPEDNRPLSSSCP